jgi:stage II sporulation protein AA (anti-sigma F factor antagonist)
MVYGCCLKRIKLPPDFCKKIHSKGVTMELQIPFKEESEMPVRIVNEKDRVTALLSGEIDHHSAKNIRSEIDYSVRETQPNQLILDFSDVVFMDSSGIGLVMGRYKLMREFSGSVTIRNPSPMIKKVMKLAGIDRLALIQNKQENKK